MAQSLYIHIPFCDQICSYCDFPKVFTKGQNIDEYLDALITEIHIYHGTHGFQNLKTLYIGGGTPTVLSISQINRLFTTLHSLIDFQNLIEVSIESNPESINDAQKIQCLIKQGITRISIGVQTFQDHLLKILQRSHTKKDVIEVINKLSTYPVEINIDMIYAIPTQTLSELNDDLDILLSLPLTHISAYSLILEEHTKFYLYYEKDQLEMVDHDTESDMLETVIHRLKNADFTHYEISNFTKNKRSYHNETYWKNQPYIAVGLGSHGQLDENGRTRYENTRSINLYKQTLQKNELPISSKRILTKDEQIEESMFLGLRLLDGINLHSLSEFYNEDIYRLYEKKINKLKDMGYIMYDNCHLRLTHQGLMLGNEVFEEFLLD